MGVTPFVYMSVLDLSIITVRCFRPIDNAKEWQEIFLSGCYPILIRL